MNFARKHDSSRLRPPVCGRTIPMTSPLRKKRPTTRPRFRRMSREERGPNDNFGLPAAAVKLLANCGLGRALVAVAVFAATASFAFASELKWRSGRSDNTATTVTRLTVAQTPSKSNTAPTAEPNHAATALQFVRPSSLHVDSAVRQTAFEESAPRLT